jgi:NADPH:quinone reductase-like Zn-dependent oxidoreductase/SAM-dependent methyltransferase
MNSRCDYSQYLALLGHSNPTMKVLEIGAGRADMTGEVLRGLIGSDGERMYVRYVYTDASESSFEAAQERFKNYEKIEYKVLDISKDAVEQGFEAESYDLIVASNSLHETPSIQATLQNVRKLMKPGARLLLQELNPAFKVFNFINGFRPEWWVGVADGRTEAPYIESSRWDNELREAGLSGNDAVVFDDDHPYHINASIISTLSTPSRPHGDVVLLTKAVDGPAKALSDLLTQQGFTVSTGTLADEPRADADVISLLDLEKPFYYDMSAEEMAQWQAYIGKFPADKGLLWVTGLAQVGTKDARYATTIGATRNVRSELSLDWATLETDVNAFDAETVAIVFEKFRNRTKGAQFDPEWEYALVDNSVLIPRYQWIDMALTSLNSAGEGPRKLEIARMGQLQTLQWVEDLPVELNDDEVIVEPRAIGMNFKDVLVAMGIVEGYKPGLGIECSGVIRKIGPNVKNLSVGDRVMTIGHGCFTTNFVTEANLVIKISDKLSFEEAATIPCVYATAIHALINLGGMTEGDSVLIHSACGGVGIAAINVAQMMGAKIYATVGNPDKVQYLIDNFGIPREHIFNSRDASFYGDLMAATNGRGADLVLNSLSGELLHVSWKCVAQFGKMLEIGKRDFIGKAQLGMDIFESNRSFHGIDMSQMAVERPDVCQK